MAINGNFTQSFKSHKVQKQKVTQKDLTSFQDTSTRLTKDTFSFSGSQNKHNDKIAFGGIWKSGPMVPVTHRTYTRYGTSGSWSEPVTKHEESQRYHPYSWETLPQIDKRENKNDGEHTGIETSRISSNHADFKEPPNRFKAIYPEIGEALNREWSLYHKQEDLRVEGNEYIEKGNSRIDDANAKMRAGNRESEKFFDWFTGDSDTYYEQGRSIKEEADGILDKGRNLHKIRDYIHGEEKELESRRAKGEVVDISVRNKSNPDAPFKDFLEKLNTETYSPQRTVWNLISLPNETMKVADAILISLGHVKDAVMPLSDDMKVTMIKGSDVKSSDFVRKVMNGLPKVLK